MRRFVCRRYSSYPLNDMISTTINLRGLSALVTGAERYPPGYLSLADAIRRLSAGTCFDWSMHETLAVLIHRKTPVLAPSYQDDRSAAAASWKAFLLEYIEDLPGLVTAGSREPFFPNSFHDCIVALDTIVEIETQCNLFYQKRGRLENFPREFHFALLSMHSLPPISSRRSATNSARYIADAPSDPQFPIRGHYNNIEQLEARITWLMEHFYTRRGDWSRHRTPVKKNELVLKVWMALKNDGTLSRDGRPIRDSMIHKLTISWNARILEAKHE